MKQLSYIFLLLAKAGFINPFFWGKVVLYQLSYFRVLLQ
jgi:hypothetical protein